MLGHSIARARRPARGPRRYSQVRTLEDRMIEIHRAVDHRNCHTRPTVRKGS